MKKSLLITLLLLFPLLFSSQIFKFVFTGANVCPTPGNTPVIQDPSAMVSPLNRVGTSCNIGLETFNSNNWSISSTFDDSKYVEVTVSAMGEHQLNITSFSFDTEASSTGPTHARVAMDTGNGSFSQSYDFTPSTNTSSITWDFPDFSVNAGYTVRFRIYGWAATATTGTMRFNNVQLSGTVDEHHVNWALEGNSATNPAINYLGTSDNQPLVFRTNNAERMRLTNDGKATIGGATTTCADCSGYRLFVRDGIRTEKVKVDIAGANGWADYVFKSDYRLKSLEEVDRYIQENGHLPNIPSANEIVQNGLDLGAMDAKLLEKIEELTIYSIDLNEKNKVLTDELVQQKELTKQLLERVDQLERKSH